MKRRNIAVCYTGCDPENEAFIVSSIHKRCAELDINLLAFASLITNPSLNTGLTLAPSIVRGESEIFNLINYDMVDGIIILGESLISRESMYKIDSEARSKGIPVVNINDPLNILQKNIMLSDQNAMELVVEHLVSVHGLKRINFIGGFPGNQQTEERLAAYKKVLVRHGLPVEEERIAYGKFWKEATECTEQFMQAEEKPEAIVCANDSMAFFSIGWLREHGFEVPRDVIVTGFDGIADGGQYNPSITTVRKALDKAGSLAVDVICDICDGKSVPDKISVDSLFIPRQSCGCVPIVQMDSSALYSKHYDELNNMKGFNNHILKMNTAFANVQSSKELFLETREGARFFDLKRMYICIGNDIENDEPNLESRADNRFNGICDKVVSMVQYGHDIPIGTVFNSSELLPENIFNEEKAVFIEFSPLYFKDDFLGYIAYEPTRSFGSEELFPKWVLQISNNAGSFYMNKELQYFVDKLESLYMRDPLTGLYNRRGLERLGKRLLGQAQENNRLFTVMCADLDHLKPINDIYGHEAGDNAILQAALAIKQVLPEDSVCVRTGGDEYCVLLSHSADLRMEEISEQINSILEEYNKTSGLPYSVSCSCGWCTANACELESFDQLSGEADENMYRTKMAKKAAR